MNSERQTEKLSQVKDVKKKKKKTKLNTMCDSRLDPGSGKKFYKEITGT